MRKFATPGRLSLSLAGLLAIVVGASSFSQSVPEAPHIAALEALAGARDGAGIRLQGYRRAGDGGGGSLVWRAGHTGKTDRCVTFSGSGNGRWVRAEGVLDLRQCGAVADGRTDNKDAIDAALATGRNITVVKGQVFGTSGGHHITRNGQSFTGGGTVMKVGRVPESLFYIDDFVANVSFHIVLDGNSSAFRSGQVGSGIHAFRAPNLRFHGECRFFIDDCIKAINSPGLYVDRGAVIRDIHNIGVEMRSYGADPRTGQPWKGPVQSPSGSVYGTYRNISDGQDGAGNGTGVDFSAIDNSRGRTGVLPVTDLRVGGTYIATIRGIWSENNDPGGEARNIVIDRPRCIGDRSGKIRTKDCVGVVGGINWSIVGVVGENVGNFDPGPGAVTALIHVSGSQGATTSSGIKIDEPVLIEDPGNPRRTQYGVYIALANDVEVRSPTLSAARIKAIHAEPNRIRSLRVTP